jgi:hypothetical protein
MKGEIAGPARLPIENLISSSEWSISLENDDLENSHLTTASIPEFRIPEPDLSHISSDDDLSIDHSSNFEEQIIIAMGKHEIGCFDQNGMIVKSENK